MINFTITGDKELMNFFKGMRENVSKSALRAAGRSALGIVVRDARKNIPKDSGDARSKLGVIVPKKLFKEGEVVVVATVKKGYGKADRHKKPGQAPIAYIRHNAAPKGERSKRRGGGSTGRIQNPFGDVLAVAAQRNEAKVYQKYDEMLDKAIRKAARRR